MRWRRRLAAGSVALASGLLGALTWAAPAARAQPPDAAAWWNVANRGDPAPQPPAPPDVKAGDLFVEGSNAVPGPPVPLPVSPGNGPVAAQAVAGLAWSLAPTDTVGDLRLAIDGSAPPAVSVTACEATATFAPVENGPWTDVPTYDGTACVTGALQGDAVVFQGVAKLLGPGGLDLVLLPGPLDRVVFKPPSSSALPVQHGGAIGGSAPAFGGGPSAGGGPPAPPASSGSGTPDVGSLPGVGTAVAPTGPAPVVAGTTASPATTPAATAAATGGLTTGQRRAIALAVIAAEVLAFALLTWLPAPTPALSGGAAGVAGGRLRPPDRLLRDRSGLGGVGRFRQPRSGPIPHL